MTAKIATITLNPAFDLIGQCGKIDIGELNLIDTLSLRAAGKGLNVAKILKKLGNNVTVSGFLGQDNDEGFLTLFKQNELINQFIPVPGNTRINVKITESQKTVTEFNFSGFSVSNELWEHFKQYSLNRLSSMDCIVVSGSLPKGICNVDFSIWLSSLKKICPKIVFDSSRDTFCHGLNAKPWLVKPNCRELEIWVGHSLNSIEEIIDAGKLLLKKGIEHAVISIGSKGSIWLHKDHIWIAKPCDCEIISTVGAGDTLVAGIVHGLFSGNSISETLKQATALSCLTVNKGVLGLYTDDELQQAYQHTTIEQLS